MKQDHRSDWNQKLILLYLAKRLQGETENELMAAAIGSLYLDYFAYRQALLVLQEQGLLELRELKNELCCTPDGRPLRRLWLTERGTDVLSLLLGDLPLSVRQNLDRDTRERRPERERRNGLQGAIQPDGNGEWLLELSCLPEAGPAFALRTTLPERSVAEYILKRWRREGETLVSELLHVLYGESGNRA